MKFINLTRLFLAHMRAMLRNPDVRPCSVWPILQPATPISLSFTCGPDSSVSHMPGSCAGSISFHSTQHAQSPLLSLTDRARPPTLCLLTSHNPTEALASWTFGSVVSPSLAHTHHDRNPVSVSFHMLISHVVNACA